jgi:hypothetical protein
MCAISATMYAICATMYAICATMYAICARLCVPLGANMHATSANGILPCATCANELDSKHLAGLFLVSLGNGSPRQTLKRRGASSRSLLLARLLHQLVTALLFSHSQIVLTCLVPRQFAAWQIRQTGSPHPDSLVRIA